MVGFDDRVGVERAHHAAVDAEAGKGLLKDEAVDGCSEHTDMVGGGSGKSKRFCLVSPKNVPAADNNPHLNAERINLFDRLSDLLAGAMLDTKFLFAHQGFSRQFQENPLIGRFRRRGQGVILRPSSDGKL